MNVTIIGSGFAALAAIRTLRLLDLGRALSITVVAPQAQFTYLPSLIWLPSALRTRQEIVLPLAPFFERMDVTFHTGSVTAIQEQGRCVLTAQGRIRNDALLIACGGQYLQKLPGSEQTINPCSGVVAAETFRDHLQRMSGGRIAMGFAGNPAEPSAVRGGPMFEFLFGLHTQLRREGRREQFALRFFSPLAEPGKRLGARAVSSLLRAMQSRQIDTYLGAKLLRFTPDKVVTEHTEIPADLILFLPGMTGQEWFARTGFACSPGGFFEADAYCRVNGGERVYVAGDAGSFPGPDWRAKQAHMAELQAHAAAINLYDNLHGRPARARFRTELLCIVDTLDSGMAISRFPRMSFILPPSKSMHWLKLFLEWKSLHKYR